MTAELEILKRARALLQPFENWTQNSLARNRSGAHVRVGSKNACQLCLIGATHRASYGLGADGIWGALDRLAEAAGSRGFEDASSFNDRQPHTPTGHAAVLALFDEAIELAEKETIDE